jgi:hypothetical protein
MCLHGYFSPRVLRTSVRVWRQIRKLRLPNLIWLVQALGWLICVMRTGPQFGQVPIHIGFVAAFMVAVLCLSVLGFSVWRPW